MNYLSVERLEKNFGERVLFQDLQFGITKGDKVALVANNGSGKSCLLKIIAGEDQPDQGEVVIRNGITMSFLGQDPAYDPLDTIHDIIHSNNEAIGDAVTAYKSALETGEKLDSAMAKMDELGAWDYEQRLTEILTKFNIQNLDQNCGSLSGGQRKRLALAICLIDDPDLLILDEPTNHLDVDMIEWLEKYLSRKAGTLFMVTHDRYFLEKVCNVIIELHQGSIYNHPGNYSYFLRKRAERLANEQVEIEKAGKLMKTELDWIRRMPKARGTKSKARIQQFHKTKAKANSGVKQDELKLNVKMTRVGGKILELKKIRKAYGDLKILDGFDYTFKKGERIGIIGPNGVGKSTFLNVITEKEKPDSGKIDKGDTIVMGHYTQDGIAFDPDMKVIDVLRDIADIIELGDGSKLTASQFLNHFMFPPKMQHNKVAKLSGGEKRRLYLMTVLLKNPNFLILDEPTNDLDLLTLNKLEDFLLQFGGCLIMVSHDRYFMDTLVDHLFVFEGDGQIRDFYGSYTEFREQEEENEAELKEKTEKKEKTSYREEKEKTKLTFKERTEYEALETDIPALEDEKSKLENEMGDYADNYEEIQKRAERIAEIIKTLEAKTDRWLELSEFA